jgi:hypothetical protein
MAINETQIVNLLRGQYRGVFYLAQKIGTPEIQDKNFRPEFQFSILWARRVTTLDQILGEARSIGDRASMNHLSGEVWTRVLKCQPSFLHFRDEASWHAKILVGHVLLYFSSCDL